MRLNVRMAVQHSTALPVCGVCTRAKSDEVRNEETSTVSDEDVKSRLVSDESEPRHVAQQTHKLGLVFTVLGLLLLGNKVVVLLCPHGHQISAKSVAEPDWVDQLHRSLLTG